MRFTSRITYQRRPSETRVRAAEHTGVRPPVPQAARMGQTPSAPSVGKHRYTPGTPPGTPPKIRDQWPFLDEPDCPVELKALVTQKITSYHKYVKLYPQLRECEDLTQCADVAGRLLQAYLDNQAIFREMEYYQKHRRVLGRHPFFKHFQKIYRLRAMTTRQLMQEEQRTKDNIWRVKSELRKGDKPHLEAKRQAKLQEYELKLQEIKALLGDEQL